MRVGIVGQRDNDQAVTIIDRLLDVVFAEHAAEAVVDPVTAAALGDSAVVGDDLTGVDLAISVGGDGTFLYTAHQVGSVPILGINLGEVGFLTTVAPAAAVSTVETTLEAYQDDTLSVRSLARLSVTLADRHIGTAVNEAAVQYPSRGPPRDDPITVTVDGSPYTTGISDGVLVATPTGSTAYNLSERGPLLHPSADVLVVTPMAPAAGTRSLVVDQTATIEITPSTACYLVIDGRDRHRLDPETTVSVTTAAAPLQVVAPDSEFFDALDKLR